MFAAIRLLSGAVTVAVILAPQASATQSAFLQLLAPNYPYLSASQLLREGAIACGVARSGHPMSDAVPVIQKDLRDQGAPEISVAVAIDIAAAAGVHLGC